MLRSCAALIMLLTLSTPLLEAPSISIGEPCPSFIIFANILAQVVLPQPLAPAKRNTFLISFTSTIRVKILTIEG